MAEGFLEHFQAEKTAEEIAEDCFAELLSRSLIQPSNRIHRFVMHDLVNDLDTLVSGKSCCKLECGGNISENVRHLSYPQEEYDIFKKFEILYDLKCLRSFLPINLSLSHNNLSKKVVNDFIPTLRRLRVLSLSKYINITMLPDSIRSLVQLRYLDLSRTRVKSLLETTCNLYHLQTLILSQCWDLTELPIHIGKLINLRHLDISETNIKELSMQIVGLENLQTLTVFIVGKPKVGLSVRELGKFPNLRGRLSIKNLHNVIDAMEAYEANLKSKEHIETLELQWDEQTEDSRRDKVVLEGLQPSTNLKELRIDFYWGTSFSSWREWLPFEGKIFPFPHLKALVFRKCPELRGHFPSHLSSIQHVGIDGCDCLLETPPILDWLSSIKSVYVGRSLRLAIRTPWPLFACESSCMLQHVKIFECDTLPSLPKMVLNNTCLQRLELYNVPSLTEFSTFRRGLRTSLQSLIIQRCKNLAFPLAETWSNYTSLVTLKLGNSCDAVISFPLDAFPTLQSLSIKGCKSLESICISKSSSPLRPSTLQSFEVKSCKALRSLPQRMDTLTALEKLTHEDLPELELPFCEGVCLPLKLQSISIVSVRRTTHINEWGLQHLPVLSKLYIGGNDDMAKTLLKERLLPISLVSLTITLISKTKCLDGNGLRHLSSLETLRFYNCTELESLGFEGCQRFGSLPEDRLPSSLKILTIWQCFQLEEWYKRPEHWSKIVHIPVININGQVTI